MARPATFDEHFFPPITTAGGTVEITHPHTIPAFAQATVDVYHRGAAQPFATLQPGGTLLVHCPQAGWLELEFRTLTHTEAVRYLVVTHAEQERLGVGLAQAHDNRFHRVAQRWADHLQQRHSSFRFDATTKTNFLQGMAELIAKENNFLWHQGHHDAAWGREDARQHALLKLLQVAAKDAESYEPYEADFSSYVRSIINNKNTDVIKKHRPQLLDSKIWPNVAVLQGGSESEAVTHALLQATFSNGEEWVSAKDRELLIEGYGPELATKYLPKELAAVDAEWRAGGHRLFADLESQQPSRGTTYAQWFYQGSAKTQGKARGTRQAIGLLLNMAQAHGWPTSAPAYQATVRLVGQLCHLGMLHTKSDKKSRGIPSLMVQIRRGFRAWPMHVDEKLVPWEFEQARTCITLQFPALRLLALLYDVAGHARQLPQLAHAKQVLGEVLVCVDQNPAYKSYREKELFLGTQKYANFDLARAEAAAQMQLTTSDFEQLLSDALLLKVFGDAPQPATTTAPSEDRVEGWHQELLSLEQRWETLH